MAFVLSISSVSTMTLTLTFSFGVAEIILMLVFFTDFFAGIEYLLQRHGGYEALSKLSNIKFLSVMFYLAKIILCVLPNLVALLEVEALVNISASALYMEIVGFKKYAVMLFFVITFIVGIWWYNDIRKYFSAIKKDTKFINDINMVYENKSILDKNISVVTLMRKSFILTAIGLIFLIEIPVEKISILPDIIATLLIWSGAAVLKKQKKTSLTLPAIFALICQIGYTVCFKMFGYTGISDLNKFPLKNALILAAVSAIYASACFFFISKAFDCLAEVASRQKNDYLYAKLNKLLILYALYLILTVIGITLPTVYITLLLPRIVLIVIFITMTIKQYYKTYDDYTAEL
ncbi:MAG: hypothetical protein EOM87_08700 [Clostridia bacterium]|nr:hypothetical protein [Clostridia bacterium]